MGVATRSTTLSFTISHDYPPVGLEDIQWSYMNATTHQIASITDISNASSRFSLSDDLLSLAITNIHLFDGGIYTLSAVNPAGHHNVSINLIIHGELELADYSCSSRMTIQTLYPQCNQSSRRAHYQAPSLVRRERVSPSAAQQMVSPFPPLSGSSVALYCRLASTHASTWTSSYSQGNLFVPVSPRHCGAILPSAISGPQTLEITAAGEIMRLDSQLC